MAYLHLCVCYNGAMMIHLYSVDSTNDYLERKDLKAGTVVLADMQTKGRGRGDHKFSSPEGGIYFSCLFKDESASCEGGPKGAYLNQKDAALLTPKAAVAVCSVLEEVCGLSPKIKWVNDIYINGKKVCGILCEHKGEKYIAGIGINILSNELPDSLKTTAAGIFDGYIVEDPEGIRSELAERIAEFMYKEIGPKSIVSEYEKRLNVLGKDIRFTFEGEMMTGKVLGINEYCNLIVRTNEKDLTLSSGEIEII